MGQKHLNTLVTVYLEDETAGLVSEEETVQCAQEGEIKEMQLMV